MSLNIIHLQTDSIRKENFICNEERTNIENTLKFIFDHGKLEFYDDNFVLIVQTITSHLIKQVIYNLENWEFKCKSYVFQDYVKLEFTRKI
jgi:hypothetical protein